MLKQQNHLYEFGAFRLDPDEHLLTRNGQPVPLTPRAFDVLVALIRRSGHLVTKEELMMTVWRDSIVEDGNLTVTISMLRKALVEEGNDRRYIQTISKQGYRFIGEIREAVVRETATSLEDGPSQPLNKTEPPPRRQRFSLLQAVSAVVGVALLIAISVRVGLVHGRSRAGDAGIHSIAVLPFANLSGDSQNDYLGLGIADAVITALGSMGQTIVRPTTAVLKYDTEFADPIGAGREQQVDAVLEGRIQASTGRIQVNVRLVRVADGASLWAGAIEENQREGLTAQSISDGIVRSIIQELAGGPKKPLARRNTKNTRAYQLYLQGRYFWDQRTEDGIRRSINYFRQAIAEDPDYALAYAGMADCYTRLSAMSMDPAGLMPPLAKASAFRALQLDDSLAEVHASLGFISFSIDWNWNGAEKEFQRAISLDPSYNPARHWYADTLAVMGRLEEALDQVRRAEQSDPLSPITHADLGRILYLNRRYEEAMAADRRALELDPNFTRARTNLAVIDVQRGAFADAILELEEAQRRADAHPTGMMGREWPELVAYAQGLAGRRDEARRVLKDLTERSHHAVKPFDAARACLGLGDRSCALEWLERAYQAHDPSMAYAKADPSLDPVRSEPRFSELLRRMGL